MQGRYRDMAWLGDRLAVTNGPPAIEGGREGRVSLINPDGSFNVLRKNTPFHWSDLYHRMLSIKWRYLFAVIVGIYAAINFLFAAAYFASRESGVTPRWVEIWLAEAAIALLIAVITMARKARKAGQSLVSGPARKFGLSFVPPLAVGVLLTYVLYRSAMLAAIPAMWLMLYGTAVITGGAFSVSIVPVLGLSFLALGALEIFAPAAWVNYFMALGFGGLHPPG